MVSCPFRRGDGLSSSLSDDLVSLWHDVKEGVLVHAKDCTLEGHKPVWEPIGEGDIDWQGQIDALAEDHYEGFIDLETWWPGIGDCARNLKRLLDSPLL